MDKSKSVLSTIIGKTLKNIRIIKKELYEFNTVKIKYTNLKLDATKETAVVIMSCFNNLKYTIQAMDSYYKSLDKKYNYVLIIVDDGSKDNTKRFFMKKREKLENICYIRITKNSGVTKTWNQAIYFALKKINPHYLFLINNDIILPKGVLSRLLDHLKNNKEIGIIGPLTNTPGHQTKQNIKEFLPNYHPKDSMEEIQRAYGKLNGNKLQEVGYINGFFMGFKKQTFEGNIYSKFMWKTYYFNPFIRDFKNEDEFQNRLKNTKIAIASDSFVFHYKDVTCKRNCSSWTEVYRREK
jgi:GT2 family glycosyltransferase